MERLSTVDLLLLTSLYQVLLILSTFLQYKLNEEVNCTEPSPSLRVPWIGISQRQYITIPHFNYNVAVFKIFIGWSTKS
jgi:hypothetical protein